MAMLRADQVTDSGFYWYLDAIGSPPQVVQVAGEDRLAVRFAGRAGEDALVDLAGSFVGPLRPPGAHQSLSDAEQAAVKAAVQSRAPGRAPADPADAGEGHPS
jgi:hypothetical protein